MASIYGEYRNFLHDESRSFIRGVDESRSFIRGVDESRSFIRGVDESCDYNVPPSFEQLRLALDKACFMHII
jgi:hypothetical protein